MKAVIAEGASSVIRRKGKRDLHISVLPQRCCFDRPLHRACEAVSRPRLTIAAGTEPRKNDRHSATDRLAVSEQALRADKQNRPLAARSPVTYVSALKINVGFGSRRRDYCSNQTAGGMLEPERISDVELIQLSCFVYIACNL